MTVNAPNSNPPAGQQQSQSNAPSGSSGISSSDFLSLLVGELQNQNPLQPTSTTDFMNQMSQYATFDSQQNLNSQLGALISSFNNILTMNSVNYMGHNIVAKGDTGTLQNGQVQFGYSLSAAAQNVTLTVSDQAGKVVWSGTGTTTAGMNSFNWDGKSSDGTQLADGGQYSLTVTATDDQNNSVYNYTTFVGTVTGIDNSSGVMMLDVGGSSVNVNDIVGVKS
jgi:flagellar basal-body rod modification protein FlgD